MFQIPYRMPEKAAAKRVRAVQLEERLDLLVQETSITRVVEALAEVAAQRKEAALERFGDQGYATADRWATVAAILDGAASNITKITTANNPE